jgi:sulfite reductase beta subunit-like hemoprotein
LHCWFFYNFIKMEKVKSFFLAVRHKFNELPTKVKIIIYSGGALVLAQLSNDIEYIPDFYRNYFSIFLGIGANLLAYVILQEKTKKEEKELIEQEKMEYYEKGYKEGTDIFEL